MEVIEWDENERTWVEGGWIYRNVGRILGREKIGLSSDWGTGQPKGRVLGQGTEKIRMSYIALRMP